MNKSNDSKLGRAAKMEGTMVPYWTNVDMQEPHMAFVGRWCPLHRGHTWIIEQKRKENPGVPILVLIRDTKFDTFNVLKRAELVIRWMKYSKINGSVVVIPDIEGVYYGRGVGYNVDELKPPDDVKVISATAIREKIHAGDESWKGLVAPGTADYLEEIIG